MRMDRVHGQKDQSRSHWGVCVYLLDGPKTLEEIQKNYEKMPFIVAMQPGFLLKGNGISQDLNMFVDDLGALRKLGWVSKEEDRFSLTEQGRSQVTKNLEKAQSDVGILDQKVQALFRPDQASKVTLIIQVILAMIKLPAGLLSGSVGLLNDAADTILDLLSSLLVYLGIRFNKERLVSILLVVFMLATSVFAFYVAVHRFFVPYAPRVDWFPFAAAIFSLLAGLILWTYQRYVGIRNNMMAFITESVDSRNHVIIAVSVMAGLLASILRFGILDMLVGTAVAVLILYSAIELAVDLLRSASTGQLNYSHYGFWLQGVYEHFRDAHLRLWILGLIHCGDAQTKGDLIDRAHNAFDFQGNPMMRLLGFDRQFANDKDIDRILDQLISRGWVIDQEPLTMSQEGLISLSHPNNLL